MNVGGGGRLIGVRGAVSPAYRCGSGPQHLSLTCIDDWGRTLVVVQLYVVEVVLVVVAI